MAQIPNKFALPGKDYQQSRETYDLKNLVLALQDNPLLDGALLTDLSVSTTATDFSHSLGRAWRGFLITDASASVNVWSAASPDETKFIRLDASGSATVDVWVF